GSHPHAGEGRLAPTMCATVRPTRYRSDRRRLAWMARVRYAPLPVASHLSSRGRAPRRNALSHRRGFGVGHGPLTPGGEDTSGGGAAAESVDVDYPPVAPRPMAYRLSRRDHVPAVARETLEPSIAYRLHASELIATLRTDARQGLHDEEARARLAQYVPN